MGVIAKDMFINEQIKDKEVRVISENGEQLGILPVNKALELAEEADLDLVNISPNATPPVCKIMDYGKYKYEQGKKQKEARKNQKIVEIKEMRLSPAIDTHDMEIKAKNVRKFLSGGNKVKVSIRFKGRQLAHTDKGREVMQQFMALLEDVAAIEKNAKMDGRSMFMVLTPKQAPSKK